MWQIDLVRKLNDARGTHGAAGRVISEYERLTGLSRQQLYRTAKQHGYQAGRRQRSDAGRTILTEGQIAWVSAMLSQTAREVKGCISPVEKILMDAEDNGIIDRGAISVSRLQEILRERGMNKAAIDAPTPHTHMRSLHPNHVHVIDMSVCIQYYLRGRLRMMREDQFYKNKWHNFSKIKNKLMRYLLVDHFSGCLFCKYYYAQSETSENLFDFLMSAWRGGKHEKYPFRGVSLYMLHDKGSANISHAIQAFLKGLDVEVPKSLPHNPRRQGVCEQAQNMVESWFESSLKIQPATSIEELNAWALDWLVWFNGAKKHTRHKMTRTACWLQIRQEHLRELPDESVCQDLFANPSRPRQVRPDWSISLDSRLYDLRHIPDIQPGLSQVSVSLRPFAHPDVRVSFRGADYLVSPVDVAPGGFRADAAVIGQEFKAVPESPTQKAVKAGERLAFGEGPRKKDAIPFAGTVVMGNKADKLPAATPIPKRGVVHPAQRAAAERAPESITIMAFLQRLRPLMGGAIDAGTNRAIRDAFGTSIPVTEAERLFAAAREGRLDAAIQAHVAEIRAQGGER